MRAFTREQTIAAFWSKVDVRGPEECWNWKAACFQKIGRGLDYGMFQFEGRTTQAHRVAFFFANGYLPEEKCVCHTCDNPRCCNPIHLFAGSDADNKSDRDKKGRQAKGVRHGRAKLNQEQVAALRKDRSIGMTYQVLGAKYGITHAAARRIALGITYQ